ncbi:hypothetical protein V6Z11_D11G291600 [Gossypium hirsutum]
MGSSEKKFDRNLSEINVVDEQELREASANIEPKHQNDVADLINSYKSLYPKWVFDLRGRSSINGYLQLKSGW